jgi:hypothetical protein
MKRWIFKNYLQNWFMNYRSISLSDYGKDDLTKFCERYSLELSGFEGIWQFQARGIVKLKDYLHRRRNGKPRFLDRVEIYIKAKIMPQGFGCSSYFDIICTSETENSKTEEKVMSEVLRALNAA